MPHASLFLISILWSISKVKALDNELQMRFVPNSRSSRSSSESLSPRSKSIAPNLWWWATYHTNHMVLNIKNISIRYKIWVMKIKYLKLKEVSKRRIWKTINLGKYVSDEPYQNPLHWKPDGYTKTKHELYEFFILFYYRFSHRPMPCNKLVMN